MAIELYVPGIGNCWFGASLVGDELESTFTALVRLPQQERAAYFNWFDVKEPLTGIIVSGRQFIEAPLGGVELAHMIAMELHRYQSDVEFRVRWGREHCAPFLASPNRPAARGECLSCGHALPVDRIFGRCSACEQAFKVLAMDVDTELPERQRNS